VVNRDGFRSNGESILSLFVVYFCCVFMMRKVINIFLSILFLLLFFSGEFVSSALAKSRSSSSEICSSDKGASVLFQKPCDMDHCNPLPRCPLCPSSGTINLYLHPGAEVYLPPLHSSFLIISPDALSDQGFVSSIFHPPTSPLQYATILPVF
jgi:hypothetical protein